MISRKELFLCLGNVCDIGVRTSDIIWGAQHIISLNGFDRMVRQYM